MKGKNIYCDEAGFTGANLLDVNQPYFTFATTDIDEDAARELLTEAVAKFNLQSFRAPNGELKGAVLAKETEGQKALEWIFEQSRDNLYVTIHDKLFATAGKFFDLTFEPLLSAYKPFFFTRNFHRFAVTAIYLGLKVKNQKMLEAVRDFHTIFQPKNLVDGAALQATIESGVLDPSSAVESILYLWKLNEKQILAEYDKVSDKSVGINKWTLELSLTSLHTSLDYWARKHTVMTPVCDDSAPLWELQSLVGEKVVGTSIEGEDGIRVFNGATVNPIVFRKSHESAGIQIADFAASAFYYAFNNRAEPFADNLINNSLSQINPGSVMPVMEHFDPENEQAMRNHITLIALVENSERGGLSLTPHLMEVLDLVHTVPLPDDLRVGKLRL